MKKSDFSFELPPELIAQEPVSGARDQSQLMVLDRRKQTIAHRQFFELDKFLQKDDLLVFNNTKVIPARLLGTKEDTRGKTEVLLLRPRPDAAKEPATEPSPEIWEAMIGSRRTNAGQGITFEGGVGLKGRILERVSEETWLVEFNLREEEFRAALDQIGHTPIPPYIKDSPLEEQELREKYQTVYAQDEGSVAAPTAGFHFSEEMMHQLEEKGVKTAFITLHVGLGTFAPVREDDIEAHEMHSEYAIVPDETARAVNEAKAADRRVIAVGTTTVRTLESFMEGAGLASGQKWTNIFIKPGFQFQCVDAMITNFHLPESTLLMLVSAFAGQEFTKTAYTQAVERKYRFYSFGDAMLII
ncbi:tRNA preQ1(34) S-adenosylmethionine ribosyltransferase-isomerase QueA [Patescibacteria group bacterium]